MCVYSFEEIAERVRPVAEKYGLRSVYLFGSYARGDANENSDVDLLIDDGDEVHGLFWLGGVYDDLCIALEKEVDMVTLNSLEHQRGTELGRRFVQEVELDRRRIV
ncbi:MAG: nucleotidyltransferase domain-containing protein [Oscillospiraceae bacterium]|nr:nucleotidyltransferase domain-containing protein [Oscillospiraceae bacterium]